MSDQLHIQALRSKAIVWKQNWNRATLIGPPLSCCIQTELGTLLASEKPERWLLLWPLASFKAWAASEAALAARVTASKIWAASAVAIIALHQQNSSDYPVVNANQPEMKWSPKCSPVQPKQSRNQCKVRVLSTRTDCCRKAPRLWLYHALPTVLSCRFSSHQMVRVLPPSWALTRDLRIWILGLRYHANFSGTESASEYIPEMHYSICAMSSAQLHNWCEHVHESKCGSDFHKIISWEIQVCAYHWTKTCASLELRLVLQKHIIPIGGITASPQQHHVVDVYHHATVLSVSYARNLNAPNKSTLSWKRVTKVEVPAFAPNLWPGKFFLTQYVLFKSETAIGFPDPPWERCLSYLPGQGTSEILWR